MKLLFDQNISFRILNKLDRYFPESKQVKELGLQNVSDRQIWDYAKVNNFALVNTNDVMHPLTCFKIARGSTTLTTSGSTTLTTSNSYFGSAQHK